MVCSMGVCPVHSAPRQTWDTQLFHVLPGHTVGLLPTVVQLDVIDSMCANVTSWFWKMAQAPPATVRRRRATQKMHKPTLLVA